MNKMFKKILAVVAVMSTAACLSVSAFAEGETATPAAPSASHNAGAVTVTGYAAVANATQYTVMVFKDDGFEITDPETGAKTYDASKIYYINQGATLDILLGSMLVKATDGVNALPDGDYTVRIGNNATGATPVDIDLKVEATPEGIKITLNYGDVNGDGEANSFDASLILSKGVGNLDKFTDQENRDVPVEVGDVNGDGETNSFDASLILSKGVGNLDKFTDQDGKELTTYTYTYVVPTK